MGSRQKEKDYTVGTAESAFDGVFARGLDSFKNCTVKEEIDGVQMVSLDLCSCIGDRTFRLARIIGPGGTVDTIVQHNESVTNEYRKELGGFVMRYPEGIPATKEAIYDISKSLSGSFIPSN